MKLFVLAASIGYALAVAADGDCGTGLIAGAATCDDGLYCDLTATAAGDGNTAEDAATTGKCTAVPAGGAACTTASGCGTGYTCDTTCKADTGSACKAAVADIVKGSTTAYSGRCDADVDDGSATTCLDTETTDTFTCGGASCATDSCDEGAVGGACRAAAVDADPPADVAGSAAVECATATDTCEGEVVGTNDGTCTAAVGSVGGVCNAAVAACDGDDTCDETTANAAFCKAASGGASALDSTADAGANGGACRTVGGATGAAIIAGDDRCDGTNTATITGDPETACVCAAATEAPTEAPTTDAPTDGSDDSDSPAALFYGLSMVTGAIAYLL